MRIEFPKIPGSSTPDFWVYDVLLLAHYYIHIMTHNNNVHRTAVTGVTRTASTRRLAIRPRAWRRRCCRRRPNWYRLGPTRNVLYSTDTWCATSGTAGLGFRRQTAARSAPAARPSWPRATLRQRACRQSSSSTKTHPTRYNTG